MEIELEWLKRAIARHVPQFHLHPHDRYMPCSVEYFMQHSELRSQSPDGTTAVLVPRGALTGSVLCGHQDHYPNHRLWMELDPDARKGESVHALHDVPVYAHVKCILSESGTTSDGVEALEITYITLFAYNGHYDVIPGVISTGAHDGDIEHITARIHPKSGDLIAMWYNSHRSRDGQWVAASEVRQGPYSRRHLAFIAKHGHGNYPTPGTIHRHFFLGNDKCSAVGPVWCPRKVVLLPHDSNMRIENQQTPRRSLYCTPSRGCSLSSEASEIEIEVKGVANGSMEQNREHHGVTDNINGVDVITDDPCEWVFFRGDWGETTAPICQSWYHTAETPVSRTRLQRLFLHVWPEVKKL